MKNLRLIAFVLLVLSVVACKAADRITATVTITNAPTTNGMTFVVNADTRTWYDSVTNPATQILTNSTSAGVTTNLYNHLLSTPPSGVTPYLTASNSVRLDARTGSPLSISGAGSYFSVTYSTQTVSSAYDVIVPYTTTPSALRPTITAGLVDWLNLSSASALYENSISVSNLVGRTNAQTIAGAKGFTNSLGDWHGGITNSPGINGNIGLISNGVWYAGALTNPTLTNGTVWGTAAVNGSLDVAGSLTFQGGSSTISAITGSYFTFQPESASAMYFGQYDIPGGYSGVSAEGAHFTNVVYAGATYFTNQFNQGPQSFLNTNHFAAGADISFGRYALTSLANGNNAAIPVGTNIFVEVSGPSGAFTINGINGSPNRDGKFLIILNQTGFDMTIAHQSGTDPTAGNRIITMTGADRATTANGAAMLIYSGSASRWILISLDP